MAHFHDDVGSGGLSDGGGPGVDCVSISLLLFALYSTKQLTLLWIVAFRFVGVAFASISELILTREREKVVNQTKSEAV